MDIPLGFRFCPTDQELVVHFLKRKILSQDLPRGIIIPEVDLYEYGHPEYLIEKFRPQMDSRKEKRWYFLTQLKAKNGSGKRPNRVTGLNEGVWKTTGCATPIIDHDDENITLGYKRSFCYHQKKPIEGKMLKTNWLMHELSTIDDNKNKWVLCEIHHHSSGSKSSQETKGASDAAPELFNTDDANYCLSTSQLEPIAAMIPYHYDSQVYSSTNTMIDMEYDGNIQSVNNLCSLSAPSIPCLPSNITIDMQLMETCNSSTIFGQDHHLLAPSIPCFPSNTNIDMQYFDGNMQPVNNLWSSSSSAPSFPCMPSNAMIDIQFVNNLWPCSSSAQSMPCAPYGLSGEDDSRFPSFHQNLGYPVATLQSNGTFSEFNLLGNAGMFCGLQGPSSMNGSYDHSGKVGKRGKGVDASDLKRKLCS